MRFPRLSVTTYFLLIVLPITFIVSSVGLAYLGRGLVEEQRAAIIERDTVFARSISESIRRYVLDNTRIVETLAGEVEARPFAPADLQPLVERFAAHNPVFVNMFVADADGTVIADYFPAGLTQVARREAFGRNYSDRQYFKDLLARRETVVADAVIGRISGKPIIVIIAPIFDEDHRLIGVAEGSLDLDALSRIASLSGVGGGTLYPYVADTMGQVIVHANTAYVRSLQNVTHLAPASQALAGELGWIEEYVDLDNTPRSAAYTYIPDLGWAVWVAQDTRQFALMYEDILWQLIRIELLFLFIATLVLFCLSRFFFKPLKHMSEAMSEITKGNFSKTVQVNNSLYAKEFDEVISHFNQMVAALQESMRRRDELLLVKSRFLGVVTHYFRTPLTIMRWATDSWSMHLADFKKKRREEVLQVVEGVKRLNLGFQNLFTAIEIDDQNTRLNLKRTHFKPITQRVIREMQSLATFHGVEMKPRLLDIGIIPCDPDKVSKILEIILANAIFYNHRGGRVDMDIRAQDGDMVMTISDTGIGMSEDELRHLFEPFFRAPAAKKKFTDGSGLGLYIAKAFAELHGGTLEIESRLHEGTVVRLTIPLTVRFKE